MNTATLTSQNQITIPTKLRKLLGLEAGDKIRFIRNAQQQVIVEKIGGAHSTLGVFSKYVPKTSNVTSDDVWLERSKKSL